MYVARKDPRNQTLLAKKKALHSEKKGTQRPGTEATARVPQKTHTEKQCDLCKSMGDAFVTHNTCDCRRFEKDRIEKSDFRAAKKSGKKTNPVKQSCAQLSKKLVKPEKVIKKKDTKNQKHFSSNSDSDSE